MRLRTSEGGAADTRRASKSSDAASREVIGNLLGMSHEDQERVALHQEETGQLFGEAAIDLGFADADQVRRAIEQQQGFVVLAAEDGRVDNLAVAAFDPDDPLSLSIRSLRGTISATRLADGQPIKSLMILSAEVVSEATLVAANLAVAFSQASYRTLLVDANLGAPSHHALFRVSGRTGLSTVLSTRADAASQIHATALPGLSVLPAGPAVPNAPELFERASLSQALRGVDDLFDITLIDASRVQPDDLSISEGVDAAVIVVVRDVSMMGTVQAFSERLEERGTLCLGAVVAD